MVYNTLSCELLLSIVLFSFVNFSEEVKEGAAIGCSKSDPKLNECLIEASASLFPTFGKAYPEYNRKIRDPMPFNSVDSKSGGASIGLNFKLDDNVLTGMTKCAMKDLKIDLTKHRIVLTALCPKLELDTNYEMNGNVLILPITGKGKAHISLENAYIDMDVKWNLIKINGVKHFKTRSLTYRVRPTKTVFNFENLFNGDKFLGPQINQFMNENHKEVVKMFLPPVEKSMAEHDTQELDDVMATIPYDNLFLD